MTLHNFGTSTSILNQFIAEIRDEAVQKDSMRFRRNIERIGEVLGYELSKKLSVVTKKVQTPLGIKPVAVPNESLVLCSILRAGMPLHQGLMNYFDTAENAFISAYRKHYDDTDAFEVVVNYLAAPSIEGKTLLLIDPMLATGKTLENTYHALLKHGQPKNIHIVSVIGSVQGVEYIKTIFPKETQVWIATIDDTLSSRGYIVPGLGDAGDLSYGIKL